MKDDSYYNSEEFDIALEKLLGEDILKEIGEKMKETGIDMNKDLVITIDGQELTAKPIEAYKWLKK